MNCIKNKFLVRLYGYVCDQAMHQYWLQEMGQDCWDVLGLILVGDKSRNSFGDQIDWKICDQVANIVYIKVKNQITFQVLNQVRQQKP